MLIGVNLLNYKSFQMGGVETFAKNLIRGFNNYKPNDFKFIFFINKYAQDRFESLLQGHRVRSFNVNPDKLIRKIVWERFNLSEIVNNSNLDIFFTPQFNLSVNLPDIKTVSVFHDCRYKDIPKNFSFLNKLWLEYINRTTLNNSDLIVSISKFTSQKIRQHYNYYGEINVIHNPVEVIENINSDKEQKILEKYNLKQNNFYYTISSTHKHKNLNTLIELFNKKIDDKLLITGPKRAEFNILNNKAKENIELTGYIDELEKNVLIKNCKLFLFPSIYEGFGMPIIEAFLHGKKVVTTKKASIPEVSFGKANYVSDPFDIQEWKRKINKLNDIQLSRSTKRFFKDEFNLKNKVYKYFKIFRKVYEGGKSSERVYL